MRSYKDLIVWQKSMQLVKFVYNLTDSFPKKEEFSLSLQLRRSAVSIPSNIAEGYGRNSTGDYIRFLNIARGSLYEVQTQIEIAIMLNFCKSEHVSLLNDECTEISKMLSSLVKKIGS